jgi:hypothetical protein
LDAQPNPEEADMGGEPSNDKIQTEGRKANAAQPLNDAPDHGGAERYPAVNKDDSISADEPRSFEPPANPEPPQGAGDGGPPPSTNEGRLGPGADPVEGKR